MTAAAGVARYRASEFRRLLAAARRSLERTGGDMARSVSVSEPTEAERKAIIGITGQYRDARTAKITVRLTELDDAVRETTGRGLPELLSELDGPLRNRRAEREAFSASRQAAIDLASGSPLHDSCDWYRDWLAQIAADGTLTRLINQGELARLTQSVRVLEHLVDRAGAPVLLPALAAEVTGDTKALNHGTFTSTLVLRALAIKSELPKPDSAGDRRALWETSDVVTDDLTSRVLVLNLPVPGTGLGEWLTGAALLGVPFYVTLHQLMTMPPSVPATDVYVCENPAVLRRAAADLGAGSAALLCTEGQPSTAFNQLASAIVAGGGELRYHGDFDWPGVAIADSLIIRHAAAPWRMSGADYLAGVRSDREHVALTGTPRSTPWDPGLSEAMAAVGRAIYEESVADPLIADLAEGG
ncbi:MAG TPA: TIGR02679 family protein, partial [Streptosporangiaceae bacterium]|nr:TIGR02679 family protein [Streptosporangiaceae bacterium]